MKRPGFHASEAAKARLPETTAVEPRRSGIRSYWYSDLVDVQTVDLYRDEHVESVDDKSDDETRDSRTQSKGIKGFLWKVYYIAA